ncbi:transposase [Nocardiopsis terrae]|uniref:Transposase n=1 Tax=Nocardiopsis terrae TaxID=372655 RepID=A0ABR9HIN7_9ACTN|nr:transposase [Nocardiopsis terrae]GHC86904.1 transposase [Nocardiopsis terrae]
MSRRFELTDHEWELLQPLLPSLAPQRGGRWRDHRQVLNGITYRTRTGIPSRDLPERYGPWRTAHDRLLRWEADGTWARIEEHLLLARERDLDGQIDSTVVRSHQHAAGARKRGRALRTHEPPRASARPGQG